MYMGAFFDGILEGNPGTCNIQEFAANGEPDKGGSHIPSTGDGCAIGAHALKRRNSAGYRRCTFNP